ncbi:MAG: homoserine kinase [Pseudomonadales bacterium]
MAVFTTFSRPALERYIIMFGLGELATFEAIETGIENSNYFVTLESGDEFVLTITEHLGFEDVPFFNELFAQLTRSGLPVPDPARTLDGMTSTIFCGKPAWLFPKLPGGHPLMPDSGQCQTIGGALARLHAAAVSTRYKRSNPYDVEWTREALHTKGELLEKGDRFLLETILAEYQELGQGSTDLPTGIIHGDLFRDNALFEGNILTGIIDFYHACEDFLVQDIAITINDWCMTAEGLTDRARMTALISGYESIRKLTNEESRTLSLFRRNAALRFTLTRLLSGDEGDHLKDPEEFLKIARSLYR